MPLTSKLFRGDPKLEACLVQDSAHIVQNATGAHVGKIHTALFAIDGVSVAARDLASQTYGASTAAAVLAFKQKHDIVNRSYQTQADNIVGKMTIAALDREMAQVESRPSPPPPRNSVSWTTRRNKA
jgi:hypothetical protein